MSGSTRYVVAAVVAVGLAAPAAASVEIGMTVEGPRGPFASGDLGGPGSVKVTSVQLDFGPASPGPLVAPRPVVVTRPLDALSWQFLGATASSDALRVVITITQARSDSQARHRRVVTLTNARVTSVHAGVDAVPDGDRPGLGVETVVLSYERIDVEDDGLKVYSSGT
jgi:type VI protein secretion system component Hcp